MSNIIEKIELQGNILTVSYEGGTKLSRSASPDECWLIKELKAARERSADVPRYVYAGPELSDEDLLNLKPGPIHVVYPLDDAWNGALDAAIEVCKRHPNFKSADCAVIIDTLKRSDNSARND